MQAAALPSDDQPKECACSPTTAEQQESCDEAAGDKDCDSVTESECNKCSIPGSQIQQCTNELSSHQAHDHTCKKSSEKKRRSSSASPVRDNSSKNANGKKRSISASPGQRSSAASDEEPVGKDSMTSERKRRYGFVPHWKTNRPWLEVDEKDIMYCTWCKNTGKSNAFTEGNKNVNLRPACRFA